MHASTAKPPKPLTAHTHTHKPLHSPTLFPFPLTLHRRLGTSFDELCGVVLKGVPPKSLTAAQLGNMEMQYEDKDGDMLMLTSTSDFNELIHEAQAIFVSKRTRKQGTRIAAGPRAITGGEANGNGGGHTNGALVSY